MLEAKAEGATALKFWCDLTDYNGEADAVPRWEAYALTEKGVPHRAAGRTGEEALRELVTFLKKKV